MANEKRGRSRSGQARRPYHKPTLKSSIVYEKKALACAKTDPPKQNEQCDFSCMS